MGEPLPKRIVVVRALRGLGDLLCIVPAMRTLRVALPQAEITLLSLPWAEAFVARFARYFDDFIEFPGYPGIPERVPPVAELPGFLAGVHSRQFDLALQMHGSGITSNPFTVMLGARLNAGFYLPGQYCPDPQRFLAYPSDEPEPRRHLRLMEFLGLPLQGEHMEFPLRESDEAELEVAIRDAVTGDAAGGLAARRLGTGDYVCLHAGAYEPARRWPVERFATVGDALAERGLQVVLTGSASEAELTAQVAARMRKPALNMAGRTGLGALAVLLSRSRLLITNDTGVSHLAAALSVPSIVIFLASDPLRWAPVDRHLHRSLGGQPCAMRALRWPVRTAPSTSTGDRSAGRAADCGCRSAQGQRCLGEGCVLRDDAGEPWRPLDVTPAMVLAEADALLGERVHGA